MTTSSQLHSNEIRDHILATGQRIMAGKGFSAVGLNEILTDAGVPKGSFYHYFSSKEAFGVDMLARYFDDYLAELDATLSQPGLTMAQRLMNYWQLWRESQSFSDCQGKCLAVKLGAEVADLSDSMRSTLQTGTAGIIARLAEALEVGVEEGSLVIDDKPNRVAESLYQLWVGASVMVKIVRNTGPFDSAMSMTQKITRITA
ncbi:transcriptional regulator, TetR family [Candidatus Pantoea symbiotica]|jgi:TetR/AcrR family transcriptional repressor of nem operon|uniref:Transcriptional regulator, TetR family n=1 Tax=Candidatus Pantoea symbiotica TaxID=1884370 RepID=A0A1I3Q8D8_9GAMM|nr:MULTISPECIES: TetR/AcrR family transcriptional regulator [Pantoea]KAJ9433155.1 TetR/AcrR family transcriptional regulator [Pantoea sp. YR343]MRT26765.1 TetR family transcriptional regulator [Enterobacteriaceae bacterium RIT697]SFJ29657.1 transcriptional regulator, TetR family [Pantoea symbiotica]SFU29937.1 transcriptional regulator, TetR family [Pantoea sp. YR525]